MHFAPGCLGCRIAAFFCFWLIICMGASCRMPRFAQVEPEPPYIQTKDGRHIRSEVVEVQKSTRGSQKSIISNFDAFPAKAVAAYSDGKSSYWNVGDSIFAKKIISGKINLFTNRLTAAGKPASYKPLNFFVQSGNEGNVSRFSYNVLKTMIPQNASAYHYLDRYRKLNTLSYVLGGLALGITSAGVLQILSDKKGTPGLPQNPSGVLIASVGIWTFISAAVVNEENKANLFYAVKEMNAH